jgi:transposase
MEKLRKLRYWKISDDFWTLVEPLLPEPQRNPKKKYCRKSGGGRKPLPRRRILEAIVFVARTGIQWKALPKAQFGAASSIHAYFQRWVEAGVFQAIWKAGLAEYDEMEGIAWVWQSADVGMVKGPLGRDAVGRNTTDRGKKWNKAVGAGGRIWRPAFRVRERSEHARFTSSG